MNFWLNLLRILCCTSALLMACSVTGFAQSANKTGNESPPTPTNNLLPVPGKVYTPTAFTPNGDGQNDRFEVYMPPTRSYNFQVFARNGQRVFATNSRTPWDGSVDGKQLPMGAYYYVIRATLEDGSPFQQAGYVMLIR